MAFELFGDQDEVVGQARALIRAGETSFVIQAPTGFGKTVVTTHMIKTAASRGYPCMFVVHRRELIRQTMKAFDEEGIQYGVIGPKPFIFDSRAPVQIASKDSLVRRLDKIPRPKIIFWDECRHIVAGSWNSIYAHFDGVINIGLDATPERLDGTGLEKHFDNIIQGPSVRWLIDNNRLCDYRMFVPGGGVDTSGLHTRAGDYRKEEVAELMDRPSVTGNIVKHYLDLEPGKRALMFAASLDASRHYIQAFQQAGISAQHVDGDTPTSERDLAMDRFGAGDLLVLSNVGLFGEGLDVPAAEVLIDAAPTKSETLVRQRWGRVLRYLPGKTAIILDHANNCGNLRTYPCAPREWTLEGTKGKSSAEKGECPIRICGECFAAQPSGMSKCAYCGTVFPIQAREVEERDGDLKEIEKEKLAQVRTKENRGCKTMADAIALGKARGYKNPEGWARHYMRARGQWRQSRALTVGKALHG